MQDIVVITGPTACGKSALAVEVAKLLGGEIINADSVQVYRDFNIAACKPDAESLKAVAHHLYDHCDPSEPWNVGRFIKEVAPVINDLSERKITPIFVGGSGLYIRSLITGLINAPEGSSKSKAIVENKISSLEARGLTTNEVSQALHAWLGALDIESQKTIHAHDRTRIVRALLVNLTVGKSVATLREGHKSSECQYRALVFSVSYPREVLYQRIDQRVEQMIEEGLIEEAAGLEQSYGRAAQPFQSIGYRQSLQLIDKQIDREKLIQKIQMETRRFAKRQLTWWRNQPVKLGWQIDPQLDSEKAHAAQHIADKTSRFLAKVDEFQGVAPVFQSILIS